MKFFLLKLIGAVLVATTILALGWILLGWMLAYGAARGEWGDEGTLFWLAFWLIGCMPAWGLCMLSDIYERRLAGWMKRNGIPQVRF